MPNITVKDAFSANVVVNTINANGQAAMANSSPVVIASDQTAIGTQTQSLLFPSSTGNNTTVQLAAAATFTGTIETVLSLQAAQVEVTCDQPYTVIIEQFIDAAGTSKSSTDSDYTFTRLAGVPLNENITLPGNYFRLKVTNTGGSTTTTLKVDTTFGIMATAPYTNTNMGNMKVALRELNGTAIDGNSGNKSAGTLRTVIATDQPNLTTPLNVNEAQAGGVAVSLNQGAADAGTRRVAVNNEQVQDLFITGQGAQSAAGNNVFLATAGTGSTDTVAAAGLISYRSFYCQIIGGAGIASGQIIFEGSNDNTTFVTIPVYDSAVITGTPILAAITIAASTNRFFAGKTQYRYIRCRISTVFSGGTIQAITRFSITDYVPHVLTVGNPTAANLLATVSATNLSCNVAQINGVSPLMGNGVTGTGSPRVTISSDNTANSNPWLDTLVASAAQGASTTHHLISAATTNATSVKGSAGTINTLQISNINAAIRYLKLYNKATAPTVGTDTPVMTIMIPPNTNLFVDCGAYGIRFSTGIAYALTTGITVADVGAVAISEHSVGIFYT